MTPAELRGLGIAEDEAQMVEEVVAEKAWIERFLELFAWTINQRSNPQPLDQSENWPDEDVFHDELLRWIALRDPDFFDVARFQLSDAMLNEPLGYWARNVDFAAKLLASTQPLRRGAFGENAARDILLLALAQFCEGAIIETPHLKRRFSPDHDDLLASDRTLSERMVDLLTECGLLPDEEDVPSPDAIRFVLSKKDEWMRRHGLSWNTLDSLFQ